MRRHTRASVGVLLVGAALAWARPALAQPPAAPAGAPRWEIEAYGGASLGRLSSGGTLVLPGPGEPIATSSPTYPSWRVPTWLLGDGASFLNQVAAQFGLAGRVAPLDDALAPTGLNDAGTFVFGARVRVPWRGRYSFEGGVELLNTSGEVPDELLQAAEAARASFESTFLDILATGPFAAPVVTSSRVVSDGSSREMAFTGALVADFAPWGRFVPYGLAGGGLLTQVGDPPSVSLEGAYRAAIDGVVPIDERDRLSVAYGQRSTFVIVLGGGLRRDLSAAWGLRIDARVLLGPGTTRVALDAHPQVATAAPAGFIESFTYPNLQFSNNPSTGRESTLSGVLDDYDAFDIGWQTRFRVTIGIVRRF